MSLHAHSVRDRTRSLHPLTTTLNAISATVTDFDKLPVDADQVMVGRLYQRLAGQYVDLLGLLNSPSLHRGVQTAQDSFVVQAQTYR